MDQLIQKIPKNFDAVIHNEAYLERYAGESITHESMLTDAGRQTEKLSGLWNFTVDQYDMGLRSNWHLEETVDKSGRLLPLDYDFDHWETVTVPSCWNLARREYFYYESSGIYTRKFGYEKQNQGERVFLKIGAASYHAKVFLNKKFLGSHDGASTPFYIEITYALEADNRIMVNVENRRQPDRVPMHNTDWFNYGGLYRDVELIRVSATYIKEFYCQLKKGSGFSTLELRASVDGIDKNGQGILEVEELGLRQTVTFQDGKASAEISAQPELWSPENPKLYQVKFTYGNDSLEEAIGFREFAVKGTDVYLNDEKILLKGIACHEESVLNGKAITEEEIIENFKLAKEMNCNYLRLAHYPHTEKAAKIADQMGLMLWEEIPVYWSIAFENEATYRDAENQLLEMIKRDYNRASVVIWSVGNENADTEARYTFMKRLVETARQADDSRAISAACLNDKIDLFINDRLAEHLDIIGINQYYGWYDPDFSKLEKLFANSSPDKPVLITEFGGGARAGHRGAVDEYFTEDNQHALYQKQVETMGRIPYIKGISPWILYDFRCPRRTNTHQEHYNRKGLLNEDKTLYKKAFYVMRDFYKKWQLPGSSL
jgi:beta-glucuronidase